MAKYNILLDTIKSTLELLKEIVKGFIRINPQTQDLYQKVLNNVIPREFEKVGYPSLKPLSSWFTDLKNRLVFFNNWITNGNPASYWFSAFFYPQG